MAGNNNTSSNAGTSKSNNNNNELTPEQTELIALRAQIAAMSAKASAKAVKPKPPTYDGTKGTLRGFLTKLRSYHLFYAHELPAKLDRILNTSNCLTDNAMDWLNQRYAITWTTLRNPKKWTAKPEQFSGTMPNLKRALKLPLGIQMKNKVLNAKSGIYANADLHPTM